MLHCNVGVIFTAVALSVALPAGAAPSEATVFTFTKKSHGYFVKSPLVELNGEFYGTTQTGGGYCNQGGCGVVFKITASGKEKILHIFGNFVGDGEHPLAGLTLANGVLYGTTAYGGTNGIGTLFSVDHEGGYSVAHSFDTGEGGNPHSNPILVKGMLYGTTSSYGTYYDGSIYSFDPRKAALNILHAFSDKKDDGAYPLGNLLYANDLLYGTTQVGGASGQGMIYSITVHRRFHSLDSFSGGTDGAYPLAGLVQLGSTLYGTTSQGGSTQYCGGVGCGTVFAIVPGSPHVTLYTFTGGADGAYPSAALAALNGALYGTIGNTPPGSFGSVYSVTPQGAFSTTYAFQGGTDGYDPSGELLAVGNTLYGYAEGGGYVCRSKPLYDCGLIFEVTP